MTRVAKVFGGMVAVLAVVVASAPPGAALGAEDAEPLVGFASDSSDAAGAFAQAAAERATGTAQVAADVATSMAVNAADQALLLVQRPTGLCGAGGIGLCWWVHQDPEGPSILVAQWYGDAAGERALAQAEAGDAQGARVLTWFEPVWSAGAAAQAREGRASLDVASGPCCPWKTPVMGASVVLLWADHDGDGIPELGFGRTMVLPEDPAAVAAEAVGRVVEP